MALRAPKSPPAGRAREQVRAYLAARPAPARRGLRQIEVAIREAAPGAEAVFSYGIPGFRFEGKALAWYAAWAEHWSMYPITAAMRAAGGAELARYAVSKGTLRFPADAPLPVRFIKRLVKARVAEIRAAGSPRASVASRRRASGSRAGRAAGAKGA